MKINKHQKLVDEIRQDVLDLYHKAIKAHSAACATQCPKAHDVTSDFLAGVLQVKKDGMRLNGCMDDGNGPITVKSGGT